MCTEDKTLARLEAGPMREGEGGACAALHWAWERARHVHSVLSNQSTPYVDFWIYPEIEVGLESVSIVV